MLKDYLRYCGKTEKHKKFLKYETENTNFTRNKRELPFMVMNHSSKFLLTNLESRSNLFSAGGPCESPRTLVAKEYFCYFGWYEIQRFASVDLHLKEHVQNVLLSILKELLIVGSSAPSHLVVGILRFRTNICHFIKAFR